MRARPSKLARISAFKGAPLKGAEEMGLLFII
jgi:hypothetical protein